jgi:hypothetical protein
MDIFRRGGGVGGGFTLPTTLVNCSQDKSQKTGEEVLVPPLPFPLRKPGNIISKN